jgi:hypothetical protein
MSLLRKIAETHALVCARQGAKTPTRQWLEMVAFALLCGNGPGYYQNGGLWQRGRPWSEIRRYRSNGWYERTMDRINPRNYRKLSQNKIAEKALLTMLGIPTPRCLGVLDAHAGSDRAGRPLRDHHDLARLLNEDPADRICFKLIEGYGGEGFIAAEVDRRGVSPRLRVLNQDRVLEPEPFVTDVLHLAPGRSRLLEEWLVQHPSYAAFNPGSVNTYRLFVLRTGGQAETRGGYFRIGRVGAMVDNVSAGGIFAAVDIVTGRLALAREHSAAHRTFPKHPDSGVQIEGVVLPMFDAARALAERALMGFPNMNFAGLDVAVAPHGPVIIELNIVPDRIGEINIGVPMRDMLRL